MAQSMKIKVVAVEEGTGKTKTGKDYAFIEVTYKNLSFQDKVENKKINQFGSKEVFATLRAAQPGSVFTLQREKDDAGFWQWIGIAEGDVVIEQAPAAKQGQAPAVAAKSTFETPEERAKKQVYIVRQSSISAAIDTLKTEKKNPTVAEVLDVAQQYVNFVFGDQTKVAVANPIDPPFDPDDDIPM
jgi:hypothetical protein